MVKKTTQTATFGAGCFWGVQQLFDATKGIISTEVGYMGGDESKYPNPTYEQVCTDRTGYAEVIQIQFDSSKITYTQLLDIFWKHHNPTTPNRQGPDVGTQYRSVVFYYTPTQKAAALKAKEVLQKKSKLKIVTEIVPAKTFFAAEEYHQKYGDKNGISCHI